MKKKGNKYFSLKNKIPVLVLLIWTSLIGYFIWQRVNQSDRPPIDDALAYYEKAKNFWENVHKGFPRNPFNLAPTERPPGTVLLSYPLGFNEDHHGFLFRSIFIPFLIWIITILIVVWPGPEKETKNTNWNIAFCVFLLAPLSLFFQFDYGSWTYWGLMDSFFATLSALSLLLSIKSIEKRSTHWLIITVILTTICPTVKPMGYLVFLLIAAFWFITNLFLVLGKKNADRKADIKFWLLGSSLFFISGIIVLFAGFATHYLGQQTFDFFSQAVDILNKESRDAVSLKTFFYIAYDVAGPQVMVYIFLFIFLLFRYRKSYDTRIPPLTLLISGLLFILIGIWIWISVTGISQVRYFYPFFLMGFVSFLYYSYAEMSKKDFRIPPFLQRVIKGICILPALNVLALLSQTNPNHKWQEFSGTGMYISLNNEAIETAQKFLAEIESIKSPAAVYATYSKENITFSNYGYYNRVIHPAVQGFYCITPIDWARPHAYRIHEMISRTDYIIYNPTHKLPPIDFLPTSLDGDRNVIEAFLNTLTPEQGIQTLIEVRNCKLAKITDKIKLKQAFEPFLLSRSWRPGFLTENLIISQTWEAFKKPYGGIPPGYAKDTSTLYMGSIDMINEIVPAPDTTQTKSSVTLSGWIAYDPIQGIKADEIFIALSGPDGTIQYWPTNSLPRLDLVSGFHQPDLMDAGFVALMDLREQKGVYTLMLALGYKGKLIHCESIKRTIIRE